MRVGRRTDKLAFAAQGAGKRGPSSNRSQEQGSKAFLGCRANVGRPSSCRAHSRPLAQPIKLAQARLQQQPNRRARLLAGLVLCSMGAFLVAPQLQPGNIQSVEGAKALKALAKTFVYQQLTMRKNFVPLPVPIPVPIEINEPPVYLKGKPKYVNVYKPPKPTPAPVVKPTTVYHMPIYSPTYEYMSLDPMSSMYGQHAPLVYHQPVGYGRASGQSQSSKGQQQQGQQAVSYAEAAEADAYGAAMNNFNDYDDESGQYYVGRSGRRRGIQSSVTAGDYIAGASVDLRHRNDDQSDEADSPALHHHQDLMASASSLSVQAPAPPTIGGSSHYSATSVSSDEEESLDHEDEEPRGVGRLGRRVKRQVYYQSGYDGKDNCEGLPIEVNVRSRIKLDRIFPIYGKSQMKKCVKPKRPFHILPPPPPPEGGHY